MVLINGILTNTPKWVWLLLAYLVWRGIKARQPGETSLLKLAVLPALLTLWSVTELVRLFGVSPGWFAFWLVGALAGAPVGMALVRRMVLLVDRARGVIHRPGDPTLLPLVLLTFAIKFGFGVMQAISPERFQQGWLPAADLLLNGFFVGIFIGKFAIYARRYSQNMIAAIPQRDA